MIRNACAALCVLVAAQAGAGEQSGHARFRLVPAIEAGAVEQSRHRFRLIEIPDAVRSTAPTARFAVLGQALPKGGNDQCAESDTIFKNGFEN